MQKNEVTITAYTFVVDTRKMLGSAIREKLWSFYWFKQTKFTDFLILILLEDKDENNFVKAFIL